MTTHPAPGNGPVDRIPPTGRLTLRDCYFMVYDVLSWAFTGDAQTFLDGVRGDLARGVYIDPAGARTPFRD